MSAMKKIELKQEMYDLITETCLDIYGQKTMLPVDQALMRLMDLPGIPMHYPYHHYIMPAAFLTLTSIAENRDEEIFCGWLQTAEERAKTILAGSCGNCGCCGAATGLGIFFSIYNDCAPYKRENWDLTNEIVGRGLIRIAEYPGPRCCKRTLFLAAQAGTAFVRDKLGLPLTISEKIRCHYYDRNNECLAGECPFFEG